MRRPCTNNPNRAIKDPQGPVAAWVVAALGVHLFVASLAIASSACSETLERTRVARLSGPVVQVLRELREHAHESARVVVSIEREEMDEPGALVANAPARPVRSGAALDERLLDLPPPGAC